LPRAIEEDACHRSQKREEKRGPPWTSRTGGMPALLVTSEINQGLATATVLLTVAVRPVSSFTVSTTT
jgi:hypothetical protein